jgi:hypothetical protein
LTAKEELRTALGDEIAGEMVPHMRQDMARMQRQWTDEGRSRRRSSDTFTPHDSQARE